METSYDVKFWKIEVYNGARMRSYRVRWIVAGRMWRESFRTHALADAFAPSCCARLAGARRS